MAFPLSGTLLTVVTGVVCAACCWIYVCAHDSTVRPPGPVPALFFGNVLQIKQEHQHKTFKQWGDLFGDVVFGRLFQKPILVLNSLQAAEDLLNKRSSIYSDRPHMILHVEMFGLDGFTTHLRYGERLRTQRKWIQKAFGDKPALMQLRPLMRRETSVLLAGMIKTPQDYKLHFQRLLAATIVEMVYGHTVTSMDDQYVSLAEDATKAIVKAGGPAAMLVDYLPFLKHIPMWMPGAGWKRDSVTVRALVEKMINVPLELVKAEMACGTARPSFTGSLLQKFAGDSKSFAENYEDIKCTSSVIYAAGTETTSTTLAIFILTMVLFPDAFKKAQDEMDLVVGNERLPDFDDRKSLPYLECLMKEVLRWQPTVPIDIPHSTTVDDQYRGYNIARGTTVLANIWAMTRDTDMYPDPEEFRPERFTDLNADIGNRRDPRSIVFGFGRRVCPGQNFADSLMWLVMANIVAVFDIRRARDAAGQEIIPEAAFVPGFVNHPVPFKCDIRPRSESIAQIVADLGVSIC